ncbi:MAG: nuclear transport factor 2 family protein [Deltaproteobacteria bacterium]|nr:nuclear transport factor 2 family protein [Deltaproteobacteria bacterium]
MNTKFHRKVILILILSALPSWGSGRALATNLDPDDADASPPSMTLEELGLVLDNALSDAFNRHDLPALLDLFAEDLEFFHDTGGLQDFAKVSEGFKGLFSKDNGLRRELVADSLKVYPLPGYGLLEVGRHRFCHEEGEVTDCGTFEFSHVWRQQGEDWKISRVLSYGH